MSKVYLWPDYGDKPDPGDGGVRRVVEAQRRYLPSFGWEVVDKPEDADVIAAHMTAPGLFFDDAQGLMSKPMVGHCHGMYWSQYEWGGNWAERDNYQVMKLVKAADIVTSPSEWVAQIIRRHTLRDCRVVYHGIDEVGEKTPPIPSYVLWNKTRVDAICDPRPVAEVAALLPDINFVSTFLPDGVNLANVHITGKLPHETALKVAEEAAVYLATTRETFGIGTLEALAAGVPVVGYRTGGQPEIIEHMKDGYLAEPGDVQDLARGIRWALAYRDKITPWALRKAAAFLWRDRIGAYADIYAEALQRRQRRQREAAPKVSIIVPAYGLDNFLPDTLRSVQTQTRGDWECIVVDDASPDRCGAIAEEFAAADPRFRVIHNAKNQYLAGARNTGIEAARGEYILPLDADDMLTPNAVEILAHGLEVDRTVHIAYGGVKFVDEDGTTPTVYPGKADRPGYSGWPIEMNIEILVKGMGQPMPYASMFRKDVWRLTGGYRSRVRSSEDCDFWMRACGYGFDARMVTTADTLVYRNRPDSMSRTAGWADAENKDWFPWRENMDLLPAGGQPGPTIKVDAFDPLVSIIIPVGPDHAELVRDAIDSVDAQTFRRWECIVVNDTGGPLTSLPSWVHVVFGIKGLLESEIVKARLVAAASRKYVHPLILETRDSPQIGVVRARNLGAAAAHGKALVFLDADDFLMPEYLALMVDVARRSEGKEVLYADFWEDPETPGTFKTYQLPDYECGFVLHKALHSVTALYPREAFERVGGFTEGVPWEDWDLQLKLAAEGVCGRRIGAPIWAYRKHTGKRREDRYERREAGKADMLARWGDYIEGRKQLMACRTCGGGAAMTVYPTPRKGVALAPPDGMPDAVLMEDTTAVAGKKTYRGKATGVMYNFQAGRPRYVDRRDMPGFLSMQGFRIHDVETAKQVVAQAPTEMQLTAPGPPVRMPQAAQPSPTFVDPGSFVPQTFGSPAAAPTAVLDLPPPPPLINGGDFILGPVNGLSEPVAVAPPVEPPPVEVEPEPVKAEPIIEIPPPPPAPPEDDAAEDLQHVPIDDAGNEVEPATVPALRKPRPAKPAPARGRGRPRKS